ncbi:MAG TPA: PQQ-binding-like beta-propeller repeat protein, partial [Ktedonobacterales bacterium]|nr:PQQ-binding-like beta-propeller repeat protein [Ktedonobacterales bacterium]
STMQNPGGIAAGYGKLTLTALDPRDGSVRWRYQTDWHPYQLVGAPVEAGGIVYTVSDPVPPTNVCSNVQGKLVALRESDGHQLWSVSVGSLPTPPVAANGVVYTSALKVDECASPGTHQLFTKSYYALRAGDGHQLWRTDLTEDPTDTNPDHSIGLDDSLQLVDGALLATAEARVSELGDRVGHLFAFDAASGKLRWKNSFFTNQSIYSITANGLLYVRTHSAADPTHTWTAYGASDGQQVLKVSGGYSAQFLVTDGGIYADAFYDAAASTPQQPLVATQVVALDGHTGRQLWQVIADTYEVNGINALLAVRDNTVYVQEGRSAFSEKEGGHWKLEGLDPSSGNIRWSAPLQWLLGRVVVTDAALYGYSDDMLLGHLMALDLKDGHTIWNTPIDSAQNGGELGHLRSLVLGSGTLYAANESSTVTAVRSQDGAVLWKAQIEGNEVEMAAEG